jgi:hypothetical protein
MAESMKFIFGTNVRQQVATRILDHIAEKFGNNRAEAAKSLGMTRQRLFSYTSGKALPRPQVFDLILQKWNLDLLGEKYSRASGGSKHPHTQPAQRLLFEGPLTLMSEEMKVVITRKGPRLVAKIEIATDVEIA